MGRMGGIEDLGFGPFDSRAKWNDITMIRQMRIC